MNSLVSYASDEDGSNKSPAKPGLDKLVEGHQSAACVGDLATSAAATSLESEWENFEKMIAGGEDVGSSVSTNDAISISTNSHTVTSSASAPPTANGDAVSSSTQQEAPNVNNPYAYLAYLTGDTSSATDEDQKAAHNHLEAFLEKAAQAAADAAEDGSHSGASAHSGSEDFSGSESGSESASDKEKSASPRKSEVQDEVKSTQLSKTVDSVSTTIRDRKSSDRSHQSSSSTRRSSRSKRSRSRSRRSRSRSKRSRSRSRHRHRRRRSTSRSRHGGSSRRHRRRSSSRHRHSRPRSRSPRRRGSSRHRSSRHRRDHRRSRSRDRRSGGRLRADPRSRAPPPEDFKARMKRELQEVAKNALAGKTPGVTPQQALIQTMAAMHAKAQELTGVSVPKYYNPTAVNPLKYAEQQQKRKLLWSKAAENKIQSQSNWQGTEVATDEKYRKLMGIKGDLPAGEVDEDQRRKQMELFQKLDQEYAMARLTTHTHRGMGLGVVSSAHVTGQVAANSTENEQHNHPTV